MVRLLHTFKLSLKQKINQRPKKFTVTWPVPQTHQTFSLCLMLSQMSLLPTICVDAVFIRFNLCTIIFSHSAPGESCLPGTFAVCVCTCNSLPDCLLYNPIIKWSVHWIWSSALDHVVVYVSTGFLLTGRLFSYPSIICIGAKCAYFMGNFCCDPARSAVLL